MGRSVSFDFTDARALVVGASRAGIGAAVARLLQESGAEVAITGVEDAPAEPDRDRFPYSRLDVTDAAAVEALATATPPLDIVVNCAGITARGEEMQPDAFAHVLDVNLTGTFRTALAFRAHLAATQGSLVTVASMYATFGSPQNPAYGASKAGVAQLTRSLAIAWTADGIRVNAVAPGFIVTEQSARGRSDPGHVAAVVARTPIGRWGQPDDVAGAVLFLASERAAFMTGACIVVDGGYSVV